MYAYLAYYYDHYDVSSRNPDAEKLVATMH
jgi:hypothetical protein